jgi:uncharacterized protein
MSNVQNETANPAPLGLAAFGLTTILLNLHNAGLFPMDTMILSMGIFMGGLLQLFVGMMEWKKGNMFGMMAFSSYGAFWLSLVFLVVTPKLNLNMAPTSSAMGWYLLVWGIYSFFFFIITLKKNTISKLVFGTLVILFVLLAVSDFTESTTLKTIAGIEGIICGGLALYDAMAQLFHKEFGRAVLPV